MGRELQPQLRNGISSGGRRMKVDLSIQEILLFAKNASAFANIESEYRDALEQIIEMLKTLVE